MNHQILDKNIRKALTILPERYQRVLFLRFGMNNGQAHTLEAIGKEYRITRERVRQIIAKARADLFASEVKQLLIPGFEWVKERIAKEGSVVPEHWFLETYGKDRRGALLFILYVAGDFFRKAGDVDFHHRWYIDEHIHAKVLQELKKLANHLEQKKELIPFEEVRVFISHPDFLRLSKRILESPLGGYGLSSWPQVLPKSIKDKAYLVLLKEKKPFHFMEITERINDLPFGKRKALKQTVHNELIKDKRFVLVGRGLYALKEWGYKEGTVRDIIRYTLKEAAKPLTKEELIPLILKERFVQPNTIILNLQAGDDIVKLSDGRYTVK